MRLNIKLVKKDTINKASGSKTAVFIYEVGTTHGIIVLDHKVAGAPRLSEIEVVAGTKGSTVGSLSKTLTLSDGSEKMLYTMLDKVLK